MILFLENQTTFKAQENKEAISVIEDGGVIVMPNLHFDLTDDEKLFLKNASFNLKVKSIKYNVHTSKLWGIEGIKNEEILKGLISRYTESTKDLIRSMMPYYAQTMKMGNASFRPIEAENRKQSKRQDDTRLHVDAFPSRPTGGMRLLRIFYNINLEGRPRVWNIGESFEKVAERFLPQIKPQNPITPYVLKAFKITKSLRSEYDYYMLNLHDKMKLDEDYQANTLKEKVEMAAGTTWICFSDKTSHAALSGSGLLEQTIYLPVDGMVEPAKSPLYILEKMLERKLV
jgi:hypothetical protein